MRLSKDILTKAKDNNRSQATLLNLFFDRKRKFVEEQATRVENAPNEAEKNKIANEHYTMDTFVKEYKANMASSFANFKNENEFTKNDIIANSLCSFYLLQRELGSTKKALDVDTIKELMIDTRAKLLSIGVSKEQIEVFCNASKDKSLEDIYTIEENGKTYDKAETEALDGFEKVKEDELNFLRSQTANSLNKKYADNVQKVRDDFLAGFEANTKNNVLFDRDFFLKIFPGTIRNQYTPEEKSYDYMTADDIAGLREKYNGDAEKDKLVGNQRRTALDRMNAYLGLRERVNSRGFFDYLLHPIDSIKDYVQLNGIKNDIKTAYGLDDKALDKVYEMTMGTEDNRVEMPDNFGILNKDGTVMNTTAPQDEIDEAIQKAEKKYMNKRVSAVKKDEISKAHVDELELDFGRNQNVNSKGEIITEENFNRSLEESVNEITNSEVSEINLNDKQPTINLEKK